MSAKPMLRRRGSTAVLMNSLSSGSSSSSSVCGLGTLTSAMSSCFARSREMRTSSSFLISISFIGLALRIRCRFRVRKGALNEQRPFNAYTAAPCAPQPEPPWWCPRCCGVRVERPAVLDRTFAHPTSVSSCHLGAAAAEPLLHARPQHQHDANGEDSGRQRPQEEYRIIVVGDHQRLVERAFGELAEDE